MFFAQKIYYNNKPLVITNDKANYIKHNSIAQGYLDFTGAFPRHFRLAFEHLSKITSLGVIIEDLSVKALWDELYELFEPIDAAGGVVYNESNDILMIFRRGKWDLPKGKCDENENIENCAIREVSEETGLNNLEMLDKIGDTFHVYQQDKKNWLKRTAWYRMKGSVSEPLIPQAEENILKARWVKHSELPSITLKTYEAIKEVLRLAEIKS